MKRLQHDLLNRNIEQRRNQVAISESIAPHISRAFGTVFVSGAGETRAEINFPVAFVEKPSISSGFEVPENEILVEGEYPTCSVGVFKWRMQRYGSGHYYSGASLIIVTTGPADQRLIAHWQAEAKAITYPIS